MRLRTFTALAAALVFLAPATSRADLSTYSQNFESLVQTDPDALANDGWLVFGNVFDAAGTTFLYDYGPFPAPNPGAGFCAIDVGQGGPEQGAQQLSVYNDYNNADHSLGYRIESNVYREQTIGAADVGNTWTFQFDAKLGNLELTSTALAFIKTIDPNNGYALTNLVQVDMTAIPTTWNTYSISLPIDAGLVGQLLQIGFLSNATNFEGSAVFYDNLLLSLQTTGVGDTPRPGGLELRAAAPNPFRGSTRIDYAIAERGAVDLTIYDIAGRRVATLFKGQAEAGPHGVTWDGRSADGRRAPAGVYRCVLQTAAGRQTRNLVLSR